MLTEEQKAIRATGVGASEVAALLELSPYQGPLDVWLRKPTPARPALVTETDSAKSEVGSLLEATVMKIYMQRTGREVHQPRVTLRHPSSPHVLASPDGVVVGEDRGVEVKVVGARMLHHWENDSVPDYYAVQCAACMAVLDLPRWDLIALLGGTDLRIVTLERDLEIEEAILETVETFWTDFIDTNTPPPPLSLEERQRYLRARYPGSGATKCAALDTDELRTALEDYHDAHDVEREAKELAKATTLRVLELVGNEYGLEGGWGKFVAPTVRGRVDWADVAAELAGGPIPEDVIERHRGESYRMPRFYPPSAGPKKKRKGST